jgi:hypothetical protein
MYSNQNKAKPVQKIVFEGPQSAAHHLKHEKRRPRVLFG